MIKVQLIIDRVAEPITWKDYCLHRWGKIPPNTSHRDLGYALYSENDTELSYPLTWISESEFKQQWKEIE